jgi:hypothetical protein
MRMSSIMTALVAVIGAQTVAVRGAVAQLGMYTLPKSDFVWNWGEANEETRFGHADIEVSGTESSFRCELEARMRPTSTLTPTQISDFERELGGRLDFIFAVSEAMNLLERERALDWARLDCKKYEAGPVSAEESAERQNEAREKMLRELERRRERQQRDQ